MIRLGFSGPTICAISKLLFRSMPKFLKCTDDYGVTGLCWEETFESDAGRLNWNCQLRFCNNFVSSLKIKLFVLIGWFILFCFLLTFATRVVLPKARTASGRPRTLLLWAYYLLVWMIYCFTLRWASWSGAKTVRLWTCWVSWNLCLFLPEAYTFFFYCGPLEVDI